MSTTRRAAAARADAEKSASHEDAAADVQPVASAANPAAAAVAQTKGGSKLPSCVQFPLAVVLSFAFASLGYNLLGTVTKGELASVSRSQDTWEEIALLAGWRIFELGVGWFGKLDSLDVGLLDILSHGPSLYLLTSFYTLSPETALAALLVDVLSAAVPFYLLRPLSGVHLPSTRTRGVLDAPLLVYVSALSATIYTVVLVGALRLVLPRVLVLHFAGLPSLEPAYAATYLGVLPATALFGAAASVFVFAPFETTGKAKEDDELRAFDPVSATLGQTLWFNVWGYTAKSKVVIERTAVVALVVGVNTFLACTKTIYGIEPWGAAVYSGVWVLAALLSGTALGLVGSE